MQGEVTRMNKFFKNETARFRSEFAGISAAMLAAFVFILALSAVSVPVYAQESEETTDSYDEDYYNYYDNGDTGYFCWVSDEADLFTDTEEMDLADRLYELTGYGNAIICTVSENDEDTETLARDILYEYSGDVSGTVFLIDMANRMLYIYSTGDMYETLTSGRANTITDNVYEYASDENYYECAVSVIDQEVTVLEGGSIAQPMKYVSNLLLALIVALIINYFIVIRTSSVKSADFNSVIQAAKCKLNVGKSSAVYVNTTREYDPPSSSSSGGGGGGGGGGGHSF